VVCASGLRKWSAQVVCASGLRKWSAQVVCASGLRKWSAQVVCASGLRKWIEWSRKNTHFFIDVLLIKINKINIK
jgi:hypothetical protein